ncbi:MAG TPA: gamma-glutamyl-gamma-aminobutyrate hydrolase family protein [Terriglobia bacterium]|nr:gamma-glutamyl-gamma-aminobutyrate hydrolase family protein [Terriglobia bacterium]
MPTGKPTASPEPPWLVIRHVEHEHIGTLAAALESAGQAFRYLDVFRGAAVPDNPARWSGLIVMGGPMGVYEADRYPFLAAEMRLIRQAAEQSLPVLGICLGSQLIAGALGARVYPGPHKEIGWYPVHVTAPAEDIAQEIPASFLAFHWHGDTFDLPPGAVRLFRSPLYENQGFRWGDSVYGLQFHFEVNAAMISQWLEDPGCRAEIAAVPGLDPGALWRDTERYAPALERLSFRVFSKFLALAARHRKPSPAAS